MNIILLQAMMAFPVAAIFVFAIAFLLSFVMLSGYNATIDRDETSRSKKVNAFWISLLFALLVIVFLMYGLFTYKGPWIT